MEPSNIPPMDAPTHEAPAMPFTKRLVSVYFDPRKVFDDLNRRASWIGLFVIVSLLASATSYALMSRVPPETLLRKGMEMNPFTRNMSQEQKDTIIAQQLSSAAGSWRKYLQVLFAPVGVLIGYLICTGALVLVLVLMGAPLTFKKSLAVTVWGLGPPSILLLILGTVFLYVKDPETVEIVVQNNVVSNLGLLVSDEEHPVLSSLLSSIDVFSFWSIYLLGVGFTAVSDRKLTMGQALTGVLICWGLWVLLKMGFFAVTG